MGAVTGAVPLCQAGCESVLNQFLEGVVSISPGFSTEEVVELVAEYHRQPWGQKGVWLAEKGFSSDRMRRWQSALFDGDLDRGLVPREGGRRTPQGKRISMAKQRDARIARDEAEIARLQARVRELEASNELLGKAIGLLHEMNVNEPDVAPTIQDLDDSSTSRTDSSPG
ncbi:hypothetical protein MI149_10070 [Mycolicibacterium crocinum]|uniref:Transposase n=1 Tax=Mycolicibacterium crocinum TaxID=388459 RepID=A0ABY3TQ07_9MYCO|nr:hypothetical protein [Mycolicibacterium crocinum]ULN43378.1 hypothetical protein MI149_10070 [Mycolicibacterium crocinum]